MLDIGFNLLTALPETAFRGNPSITLLALDGNPLPTVPENALSHLNRTLRGLSLGGRFLHCDCKLRWVTDWIRNGDLQVTSRERNPQFCGTPTRLRDRGFYSIQAEELTCPESDIDINGPVGVIDSLIPKNLTTSTPSTTRLTTQSTTTVLTTAPTTVAIIQTTPTTTTTNVISTTNPTTSLNKILSTTAIPPPSNQQVRKIKCKFENLNSEL